MPTNLNFALGIIILLLIAWSFTSDRPSTLSTNPKKETSNMASPTTSAKQYAQAEQVTKDGKTYTAIIKTTLGDITVELSKETPATTNNFVFLAKEGYYNQVIFHRVIPGFMIQGGDPTGTGMGGPGYQFADEKFSGDYKRGTLAMANSGPNTNGSQFFLMHADTPLPPNYTIFGMTVSGLEVIDQIASGKIGPNDRPEDPVSITSIEIEEK